MIHEHSFPEEAAFPLPQEITPRNCPESLAGIEAGRQPAFFRAYLAAREQR